VCPFVAFAIKLERRIAVRPLLLRWQQTFAKLYPSRRKSRNRKRLLRPRRVSVEPLESRILLAMDLASLQRRIVDNQDAAYTETGGNWQSWSDAASYGGDFRYHAPGSGADTATWTVQALDPTREYQVYATWSPASNCATNSPFSLYDSGTLLGTKSIDQQFAPSDATIDGRGWESLGVYAAASGTLTVKLGDNADGDVVADAIRLVDVTPPPPPPPFSVIGDGDSAYAESGSGWSGYSEASAYQGHLRYHVPGDGSDAATSTFAGVDPGKQYQVYATWSAASNRATDSPFSVYDSGTLLGTKLLDQQFAPSDATIDGSGWESLGVYAAASSTLVVKLTDNADGDVIANGVRIVEVPPVTTPPGIIDDADPAYAESGSGWLGCSDTAASSGTTFPATVPTRRRGLSRGSIPASSTRSTRPGRLQAIGPRTAPSASTIPARCWGRSSWTSSSPPAMRPSTAAVGRVSGSTPRPRARWS
jgi:hypothetical protein